MDDTKRKERVKYLRRRLRNGRSITRVDAELLRSLGHEVKESSIAGMVEPSEPKPTEGVERESSQQVSDPVPPPAPPPLGSPEPAPPPLQAPVVLPGILSADSTAPLSPSDVAGMLADLQCKIARDAAAQGLLTLPDAFWSTLWKPACEALIKQYAPNIGAQAAGPIVIGSTVFNLAQAARAQSRKRNLLRSPAMVTPGEPGTGRDEPSETPENGATSPSTPDIKQQLFGERE